jgi:hypothetical protein
MRISVTNGRPELSTQGKHRRRYSRSVGPSFTSMTMLLCCYAATTGYFSPELPISKRCHLSKCVPASVKEVFS